MKYQRARLIETDMTGEVRAGYELWVVVGKPTMQAARIVGMGIIDAPELRYETGLRSPAGRRSVIPARVVELLARGPEDFADDVPLQSFEDWLAEQREVR